MVGSWLCNLRVFSSTIAFINTAWGVRLGFWIVELFKYVLICVFWKNIRIQMPAYQEEWFVMPKEIIYTVYIYIYTKYTYMKTGRGGTQSKTGMSVARVVGASVMCFWSSNDRVGEAVGIVQPRNIGQGGCTTLHLWGSNVRLCRLLQHTWE